MRWSDKVLVKSSELVSSVNMSVLMLEKVSVYMSGDMLERPSVQMMSGDMLERPLVPASVRPSSALASVQMSARDS